MTWLDYLDGPAVQIVARLAPWLAPLPTAWLVYDRTQTHLGWPWWVAFVAALTIEALGVAILATALDHYSYNRRKRKTDPWAPLWISVVLVLCYLLAAELLIVALDIAPDLIAPLAPAVFPLLSIVAMTILAIRADHKQRVVGVQERKEYEQSTRAKRKAKRDAEKARLKKLAALGICRICELEFGPDSLSQDGLCGTCQNRKDGKTHSINNDLAVQVLERDAWSCYYCGVDLANAGFHERHMDHFIPRKLGGEDIADNLVTSCKKCNLLKHDKEPSVSEQRYFALYLQAMKTGIDKKSRILALASYEGEAKPPTQAEIAQILRTSQGYVSSVVKSHRNENKQKEAHLETH